MSFDLKLLNGSISVGPDGDLDIVVDGAKLIQDVIKVIVTPVGSNRFQPQIGSLINERLIGQVLTEQNTITVLQVSVQESLITLQKLQQQQAQYQALSPSEMLVAINSIDVQRDSVEPRQLNVILKLMAGDGKLLTETFTMRLT